uniref:Uncharacterized protein n=1 Tax=Arundo donax TaxID=35708 RepID=A0A0A9BSF1_ARUDO
MLLRYDVLLPLFATYYYKFRLVY